ncbi:MAG: DUF2970 domain-containing protein [Methylophilaceae bacterium]|nr:DUF2970 domain-containing protein [Methylophilaceae bacterium]MDG1444812.1 DUF2970 domain-containing protein [Methylophilaceae bacterium]MDG1820531.1 DUF2970 domain-containing protein [Methylophilaceae bacterium]
MSENIVSKEKASIFQVTKMVLWTMIGIRAQKGYEDDIAKITPEQAIIAGIIGAIIFVFSVISLVNLAINQLS